MKITINGKTAEAIEGQTVLQAALAAGVYIPHLCYHEKVGAAGKCRACVVEIEGMRGLQTACSVPVREGMIVNTKSESVLNAQKLVINLMLSSAVSFRMRLTSSESKEHLFSTARSTGNSIHHQNSFMSKGTNVFHAEGALQPAIMLL